MKTRLAGGLVAVLMLFFGTAAAVAQPYPPSQSEGRVSRSVVARCQCTVFSGDGFLPGSTVVVTDDGEFVGTAVANADGEFRLVVCFDETARPGRHQVAGTGTGADGGEREVRAGVTVRGDVCGTEADEINGGPVGRGSTPTPAPSRSGGVGGARGNRPLPRTGAALVVPGLLGGFGLVTLGCAVVLVTRRRRLAS